MRVLWLAAHFVSIFQFDCSSFFFSRVIEFAIWNSFYRIIVIGIGSRIFIFDRKKSEPKTKCVKFNEKKWGKVQYYALISLTFSTDRPKEAETATMCGRFSFGTLIDKISTQYATKPCVVLYAKFRFFSCYDRLIAPKPCILTEKIIVRSPANTFTQWLICIF